MDRRRYGYDDNHDDFEEDEIISTTVHCNQCQFHRHRDHQMWKGRCRSIPSQWKQEKSSPTVCPLTAEQKQESVFIDISPMKIELIPSAKSSCSFFRVKAKCILMMTFIYIVSLPSPHLGNGLKFSLFL